MWVPEDAAPKQLVMLPKLGLGVQPTTGVVEVGLIGSVQSGVLACAQRFDGAGHPSQGRPGGTTGGIRHNAGP